MHTETLTMRLRNPGSRARNIKWTLTPVHFVRSKSDEDTRTWHVRLYLDDRLRRETVYGDGTKAEVSVSAINSFVGGLTAPLRYPAHRPRPTVLMNEDYPTRASKTRGR